MKKITQVRFLRIPAKYSITSVILAIIVLVINYSKTPIAVPQENFSITPMSVRTEPRIIKTYEGVASVSAQVVRVVDGDTIIVMVDGKKETVRLIGIDTPEVVDPRKLVQCFGHEASEKTKQLLTDKLVTLIDDQSQGNRDKYDRLLRYVFLGEVNINQQLLEEGYAHEYTYRLPYAYQAEFMQAERSARENKKGLWADGACPVVTATPSSL